MYTPTEAYIDKIDEMDDLLKERELCILFNDVIKQVEIEQEMRMLNVQITLLEKQFIQNVLNV